MFLFTVNFNSSVVLIHVEVFNNIGPKNSKYNFFL